MSFPISPTDGQITIVNGIQYTYSTAKNSWKRTPQPVGNLTVTGNLVANVLYTDYGVTGNLVANVLYTDYGIRWAGNGEAWSSGAGADFGNISSNLIPTANVTYDIGSSDNRWKDLWLSGNTIHLGQANLTATGTTVNIGYLETTGSFVPANLTIDPNNMYDLGPSFTLSNNNTTITSLSTQPGDAIALGSNVILQNEKIVFSTRMDAGPSFVDYLMLGVARGNVVQSDYPGQDAVTSVGFSDYGNFYESPSVQGGYPTFGAGDIVDIAVDRVNHLIWYRVNGGYWNGNVAADPATATGNLSISQFADATELYPIYSPYYNGQADQMTILNTATYTLPAGFTLLTQTNTLVTTYSGSVVTANLVANVIYTEYISSDVIPSANVTYDLGSSTKRWRDLYLSGNSLYIGGAVISAAGNAVNLPAGSTIQGALITGNVTFDGNTIKAPIDASLTIRTEYSYQAYWAQSLGGINSDGASGVTTDSTGNIYVVGTTGLSGSGNQYTYDILLAKFDTTGALIWQKILGGTNLESDASVATDSNNNVYVFDYTYSRGDGYSDFLLAKFDTNGNIVWQLFLVGVYYEFGNSVTVDGNNIYICGQSNTDRVLAKFDTDGNIVWQRLLSGIGGNSGSLVTTDSTGNVYVVGNAITGGPPDILLAKFDYNGDLIWQKVLSGTGWDEGYSVTTDSTGNVYICGSPGYTATYDLLVAKFDSNGNLIWQKTLGSSDSDFGYTITTDSDDNIYVCGERSNYNAMIVKYDPSGAVVWQRGFGRNDNYSAYGYGIAIDSNNDIVIAGGEVDPITDFNVLVAKLPNDGSGTGTYGIFDYFATTLTEATANLTLTTGSMTANTANLTVATGNLTITNGSFVCSNFVNLPGIGVAGSNSWIFGSDGSLTLPGDSLSKYTGNIGSIEKKNWVYTFGSSALDEVANLMIDTVYDSEGNIYSIGYAQLGNLYITIISKFNSQGNLLWQRKLENLVNHYSFPKSITIDSNNHIVIAVSTLFSTIAKLDTTGNILWQINYEDGATPSSNEIYEVQVDNNNNIYAAGIVAWSELGSGIVIKFDTTGNVVWQRYIESTHVPGSGFYINFFTGSIDIESSGNNLYVVYTYQQLSPEPQTWGALLVKLNSDGDLLWTRTFTNNEYEFPFTNLGLGVAVDSNNNVYLSAAILDGDYPARGNLVLAKYDNAGTIQWQRQTKGPTGIYVTGSGVSVDDNDNVYVSGFQGNIPANSITVNPTDFVLLKYDSNGNALSQKGLGSSRQEFPNWFSEGVSVYKDKIVIAGYQTDDDTSNRYDAVVVQLPLDDSLEYANVNGWTFQNIALSNIAVSYANAAPTLYSNVSSGIISTGNLILSSNTYFTANAVGNLTYLDNGDINYIGTVYSSNVVVEDSVIASNLYINKNTYISTDIIPTDNKVYNLGSANQKYKNVYISGNIGGDIQKRNWIFTLDDVYDAVQDGGSSIAYDSKDNIYVVGGQRSIGVGFLFKLDPQGNELWHYAFDNVVYANILNSVGDAIAIDSEDNVIVGITALSVTTIIKFTSSGRLLWQMQFSIFGYSQSWVTDVITDNFDNVYILAGTYASGDDRNILIKLNSSGVLLWKKYINNNISLQIESIAVDNTGGNVFLAGTRLNSIYDPLLVKVNSEGSFEWARTLTNGASLGSATAFNKFYTITVDYNNDVIAAGKVLDTYGSENANIFIAKYDTIGNLQWQRLLKSLVYDNVVSVSTDIYNNIYVNGTTGNLFSPNYQSNILIAKYNTIGSVEYQKILTTAELDYNYFYYGHKSLATTKDKLVVTGYTGGRTVFAEANIAMIVAQLPIEGYSGNITIGDWTYQDIFYSNINSTLTNSASTVEFLDSNITYSFGNVVTSSAGITAFEANLITAITYIDSGEPTYVDTIFASNIETRGTIYGSKINDSRGSVRSAPWSGSADKTTNYTFTANDIGGFVSVGSGGNVTIPNNVFVPGNIVTVYNNTAANISITCSSIVTYVAGIDTVKTSIDIYTRGVATILFTGANSCVVSGNVN